MKRFSNLKVRFEEFWAEAKLVKDELLSKKDNLQELDDLLQKIYEIASNQ